MAKLFRSGLITASATFLSRILGLVRDICIAHLLGASMSADIFFFANRIPNFFRRLFAEGAFSQAFVPVMTEFKENKSDDEVKELVSKTVGSLGAIVFLVTIIGMLGSSVITAIFGGGWFLDYLNNGPDANKFIEASFLLKLTFPYLFFISLTACGGAVLNTYGKFLVPAITPCLLNLCLIFAALYISQFTKDPNIALAYGMILGGVVQFLFQLPFLYKVGKLVLPKLGFSHEGVRRIGKLMLPAIFGVSVSQVNLLINTILASFLATGAISYLYYSDRLLEFPIGIFAVAISTVILPTLAKVHVKGDSNAYIDTLDWGVRLVLALGIPAMVGMIMLREPIIRVLFLRGEFGISDGFHSSLSLIASVSGLWAIMLARVLIQGFTARQDTKSPVRCGVKSMLSNICFNLLLVPPLEYFYPGFGYVGLALSTSLAAFVNVYLLLKGLTKDGVYKLSLKTILFIGKLIMAALLMGVVIYFLNYNFFGDFEYWATLPLIYAICALGLLIPAGFMVYLIALILLKVRPLTLLRR